MQASRTKVADEESVKKDDESSSADDESTDTKSGEKSLEEIIDAYSG